MGSNHLYHGVNEDHEFWENDNFLLMRPHKESDWSVNKKENGKVVFHSWADTAEDAARRIFCYLDSSKEWTRKKGAFKLTPKKPSPKLKKFKVKVTVVPPILHQKLFGTEIETKIMEIEGIDLEDAKRRAGID